MRVLVTGGRYYADREKVWHELGELRHQNSNLVVIQGGATGADKLAIEWWIAHDDINVICITEEVTQEEWERYGRMAGHIRNQRMLDKYAPNLVLAFHGGRGTADMVRRAKQAGVEVREVD